MITAASSPGGVLSIPIKWKGFSVGTLHFQCAEDSVQQDLHCAFPVGGK